MRFRDRQDAGRRLAARLGHETFVDPIVLALPRGGVPVGYEVARGLRAPLDVFVARKVGAPYHPEYGIGAIAEGGVVVCEDDVVRALGISLDRFEQLAAAEQVELDRRVRRYRHDRPLPALTGRTVILVDDGLATGVTAEAALRSLRSRDPLRLVLAAPVCARDTAARLRGLADEVVCLRAPADFVAVGQWYRSFGQTTDDEVDQLLADASHEP
jgi:putative phosphoribosyl transferase